MWGYTLLEILMDFLHLVERYERISFSVLAHGDHGKEIQGLQS